MFNLALFANPIKIAFKIPVCGCHGNQITSGSGKPIAAFIFFIREKLILFAQSVLNMEHSTSFTSPHANGPPSWHRGKHLDRSVRDDSGHASEDSDSVPFLSLDASGASRDTDQSDHDLPGPRPHGAAAFINAQWSRPAVFRACRPFHDSPNNSWCIYDLSQPLSFEQQRNSYEPGSRLPLTISSNREDVGREPCSTPLEWHFEEYMSPLDFEKHGARVPNALPSLSSRIESETEHSSLSMSSIRQDYPIPEVELTTPQFTGSTMSARPDYKTETPMRSSARRQGQHQSSSHDAQLAAAWQQLYHERTELKNDKRALRKKEKSLLQRSDWLYSSRRDPSDDRADEGRSGNQRADGAAKGDESPWYC